MQKHQITKATLENLKLEQKRLINEERPKVIKEIQDATALGDLSENADYDAAKNQQAYIDSRIAEIKEILENYELISENIVATTVEVGTKVTVHDFDLDKEITYEIFGTIDNDPENNKISNESPLALAILGRKVGDSVEVIGIDEPYKVKILKIS